MGRLLTKWLCNLFNMFVKTILVLVNWKNAVIVPIYKENDATNWIENYTGISLLSVPKKVFGRILKEGYEVWDSEKKMGKTVTGLYWVQMCRWDFCKTLGNAWIRMRTFIACLLI